MKMNMLVEHISICQIILHKTRFDTEAKDNLEVANFCHFQETWPIHHTVQLPFLPVQWSVINQAFVNIVRILLLIRTTWQGINVAWLSSLTSAHISFFTISSQYLVPEQGPGSVRCKIWQKRKAKMRVMLDIPSQYMHLIVLFYCVKCIVLLCKE